MTQSKASALKANEEIIQAAELGFVAKGKALKEIRDKVQFQKGEQLEGQEKMTFEAYLTERWDWSRRMADRLIAASVVAQLADQLGFPIVNEGQAREVADLHAEPEALQQILEMAQEKVGGGRVTAEVIRRVRHRLAAQPGTGNNAADTASGDNGDGLQGTLPDEDPNSGEDWEEVLKATRVTLRKLVKEAPDTWQSAMAQMLEEVAGTSRKKAIRIAKAGDSG